MYLIGKKLLFNNHSTIGHYCPACDDLHRIAVYKDGEYCFDGNEGKPTLTYGANFVWGDKEFRQQCKYTIRLGEIRYSSVCTHEYAGKTIKLADIPQHIIESYEIKPSGHSD